MYATIANPVGGIGDVVSRWKAQNIAVAIYHTSFVSVILGVQCMDPSTAPGSYKGMGVFVCSGMQLTAPVLIQGLPESHTYAVANKVAWVAAIIKKRLPESDWETLFINVAFGLWCNDPTVTSVRVSDVIPSLDQPTCFLYKGAGGKELWDKRDQIQEIITQGDVNEAFDTLAHDCNDFIKLLYLYDTDGVEILKPVFQDQIYWDGQLVTYQVIAAGGHRRYNKTAPKGRKSNTYKIVR
ncbi:hypothetical protein SARC_11137 [Sphaeroforma arctica JP610]|uniref:Uncharacterized protein n=1 Tax=Sphaeroforma arctica JP610 TaxID=667725 RepID=A0A0L0FHU6_9EUKA|nr:hypothetical protein SARC_11137 [Sphaeroforma arctica JP610]KNC76359.1 hypothetical protein SARC_11137 [Sphaeroforma arctica JP610]|eukprot:XP_014150261.1 hypothetical protein SARC_11137 [Sphaeroforma arctica JP610]